MPWRADTWRLASVMSAKELMSLPLATATLDPDWGFRKIPTSRCVLLMFRQTTFVFAVRWRTVHSLTDSSPLLIACDQWSTVVALLVGHDEVLLEKGRGTMEDTHVESMPLLPQNPRPPRLQKSSV